MILTVHQYRDRIEAGQILARQLAHYASRVDTLVLALPPEGVPIAVEVASYLNAPLDAFVVRKLVLPNDPEHPIGALAPGGARVFDDEAIQNSGLAPPEFADLVARETAELERRQQLYRGDRPPPQIAGRVVIVVDDGLATGYAMHAAIIALHRQQPAWLVVAAPVGSVEACNELAQEAHEVVCPLRPDPLRSIGLWYDHFSPTDDDEVRTTLRRSSGLPPRP
jgi:putative phosphoribosyl transferase